MLCRPHAATLGAMHGAFNKLAWVLASWAVLFVAGPVFAQVDDVLLTVEREHLGLAGQARPGAWTAVRIDLDNRSSQAREVICRWVLKDADGDRVMAQRRVTLDALRAQPVWLYGPLPIDARQNDPWLIQVLDKNSTDELARAQVPPAKLHRPEVRLIGIAGGQDLGLTPFTQQATSHERIELVRGLSLTTLPDRWYGLASIDSLIWSTGGGDPDDARVSSESQQALRQWVRRGGHLVIVLPAIGQTWTGSGLADLLPVKAKRMLHIQGTPPIWLGDVRAPKRVSIEMTAFDVNDGDGVEVVLRDADGRALVVAKHYGFGRVTLIGIDLADRRLAKMGLPNGRSKTLWHRIYQWQSPIYSKAYIDAEVQEGRMSRPTSRTPIPLGRFIPGLIAMRGTAAPALLAAVLIFGLYWVTAGPISFLTLKKKNAQRHSWVVFVLVVLGFSVVSWAGAWMLTPREATVAHFTVLDARADSSTIHAHSWLSLYVPQFGSQLVELDPDHPSTRNTLASPGLIAGPDDGGFLDPQTYTLDAGSPRSADIPFRATAKQLEVDFLGRIDQPVSGLADPIILPQGSLEIVNFWPSGRLSHGLPGPLRDVLMVYCPGEGQTPWVWRLPRPWAPREVLDLGQRPAAERLVLPPRNYAKRQWLQEGFLGKLLRLNPGQQYVDAAGAEIITSSSEMIQFIELLSFYDTLPPPDFRKTGFPYAAVYKRALGRQLDLSHLLSGKRLIVIGHLEDSPLPVPMTVAGEQIPSTGWTVVRWVYDFQ